MCYIGRQDIQSRTAKHVWDRYQRRYNKIVLMSYDKYQRMLEAQSVKTPTALKPTKKKDQMTKCPIHHPGNGTPFLTGNQKPISTKG